MGYPSGDVPWRVLLVVAAGGVLGSLGRWGLALALPTQSGAVPWATLTVNGVGAFLLGLLMVLVTDVRPDQRYLRPFWGVGVLGGFTTFSAYSVELRAMLAAGDTGLAAAYLLGTLLLGLVAVAGGLALGRRWYGGRRLEEGT
ncbi:MAG TPA: CrcB family protein [Nocardioides sp.]|nr:CrcB family protein [Nocardioides sp.]